MKSNSTIWLMLFLLGGLGLLYKGLRTETGLGTIHVKPLNVVEVVEKKAPVYSWTEASHGDSLAVFSPARTVGLWIAAFLTLSCFSYLYRDNVCYKLTEALIVGVSAGYAMVVGFWDSVIAQLLTELQPDLARAWFIPGLDSDKQADWSFLVPLILGGLLFSRFIPGCSWLAKWPLAFVVGTFAGLRLVLFLDADFVNQIRSTLLPLIVMSDGQFQLWSSLRNIGLLVSVLSCLTYFFFSIEHRGAIGRFARVGIWVLMITFGASFAFTVMGRITLLTRRFEFLFHDWLRLI